MNVGQVSAWVEQNKVAVIGVAGAGAIALGLRARKGKGDVGGGGGTVAMDTTALAAGPAIAGTVPYNSSSTDAYNSLMPAIQKLYEMQETANTPAPLPDFSPGLYQMAGGDGIYELRSDGTLDWLTKWEWDAMRGEDGKYPAVEKAAADSRLWDAQLVGDGNKDWAPSWYTLHPGETPGPAPLPPQKLK